MDAKPAYPADIEPFCQLLGIFRLWRAVAADRPIMNPESVM
ncbi:hypothetical protein C7402_101746 [Paraburkholderia unamae]|uniref:Uncharacterized protein n=1 Tax=Paraburkholderia unamae TaxID=219649 RepID=A0ABX5L091_9BURK|nr:hypothetical protein C7402_101746 [Paraburkholderia unamae]RAR61724.1 hypothetical protein C7401_10745 [Paraburkholderia unamae]